MESVLAQDYQNLLEVIFADGASNDGTRLVLDDYVRRYPHIVILDNPQRVQTIGLNMGIRAAHGDVIVRLDAHAVYAPDFVRQCVAALEKTGAGCVGGGVNLAQEQGYLPTLFGLVQEHPFGTGVARFRRAYYEGFVDTVWPGAYRREVFEKVGLFREALARTEDLDLHSRMRKRDYRIWQTPLIKAYYYSRSSFKSLAEQYFGNGEQVVETLLVNTSAIALRHLAPFLWVTSVTALSILVGLFPFARPALLLYTGLYISICVLSALMIGVKSGLRYVWVAPWIFPWIHVSYGLGSWWGVIRAILLISRRKLPAYRVIPTLES